MSRGPFLDAAWAGLAGLRRHPWIVAALALLWVQARLDPVQHALVDECFGAGPPQTVEWRPPGQGARTPTWNHWRAAIRAGAVGQAPTRNLGVPTFTVLVPLAAWAAALVLIARVGIARASSVACALVAGGAVAAIVSTLTTAISTEAVPLRLPPLAVLQRLSYACVGLVVPLLLGTPLLARLASDGPRPGPLVRSATAAWHALALLLLASAYYADLALRGAASWSLVRDLQAGFAVLASLPAAALLAQAVRAGAWTAAWRHPGVTIAVWLAALLPRALLAVPCTVLTPIDRPHDGAHFAGVLLVADPLARVWVDPLGLVAVVACDVLAAIVSLWSVLALAHLAPRRDGLEDSAAGVGGPGPEVR